MKAEHIRNALRKRYAPQSHALLFEVAHLGHGSRRFADAVAVGLWPGAGHGVEGIEIKVSRSDFLTEMASPQKSGEVMQFCDLWWLACPAGMVRPDELPSGWGLLEYNPASGTVRVKKKAPPLSPAPLSREFLAGLCRRHAGSDEDMSSQAIRAEVDRRVGNAYRQMEEERRLLRRESMTVTRAENVMVLVDAVRNETGLDLLDPNMLRSKEGVVEAVRLFVDSGVTWRGPIRSALDSVREMERRLTAILGDSPSGSES